MARQFATNIEFSGNQALNLRLHQSAGDLATLTSGKIWFDTNKVRPVWAASPSVVNDIYPFATANTPSTGVLRDANGDFTARIGSFTSVSISGAVTNATDATTKSYVDALVEGLDLKGSCRCATTASLPAFTFSSTGGGTLTANANGAFPTIDTTVTMTVGQSILVKDETAGNAPYNGIYTLDAVGDGGTPWRLVRRYDANASAEVTSGMYTYISEGTANGGNGWALMTLDPITLNVTALSFSQFSGAGQIIAGTGLTKLGNTLSISTSYVGQTSITTLGTVTTGTWTAGIVGVAYGGTGLNTSAASNGQLLIGNGSGFTLATLTQGTGIAITNGAGTISIAATGVASSALDGTFAVNNTADNTKQFKWSLGAQNTGSIVTLATSASQATGTLTIPQFTTSDTIMTLGTTQTATGAKTFQNASTTFLAAATQDAIRMAPRAGGTSSYVTSITTGTLTGSYTLTIPATAAGDTFALLGLAQTFTGVKTFNAGIVQVAAAGISTIQAATQDGLIFKGRAGGTSTFAITIQPGTLTESYTLQLPAAQGGASTVLQNNGSGVLSWATLSATIGGSIASGQVAYGSGANTINGSASFLWDNALATLTVGSNANLDSFLVLKSNVGYNRRITVKTANANRWSFGADSSTEDGSEFGSDFVIQSYTDGGVSNGNAVVITRVPAGLMTVNRKLVVNDTVTAAQGTLALGAASTATGLLRYHNSTNANTVTIQSGVTSASYTLTLPTAQGGASTILSNNGSGVLSWIATPSSTLTSTYIGFGSAGNTVTGSSSLTWNDSTKVLTVAGQILQTSTAGLTTIQAATQDGVKLVGRAGGTSSYVTTITPATLTGSYTLTLPATAANDTFMLLGLAQTVTGAKTFTTSNLTITDVNVALSATTGTQFGTATSQKLSFYGATPIVQPGAIDVATALTNLGLMATGGTYSASAISGTVAIANGGTGLSSTSQNYVFAGPTSGSGAPSWRLLTAADLPSTVAKNYSTNVGDGSNLVYVITHNLGTLDIVAQVYEVATGALIECDVVRTSTTQITLTFTVIPTSNQYRVTVHG